MDLTVNDLARKYPAAGEYITQIYLILRDYSYCNNRRLAEHMGVSPSAVSQAVNRLKKQELADQDRYGMITLLPEGDRLGREILHRHYLLEYLMVKKLGFPWALADEEAENLQDKVSREFIMHLDRVLGHPQVCPHGNPMPGNPNAEHIIHAPKLTEAEPGSLIEIVRITEEGERVPGLLQLCYEFKVMPRQEYQVITSNEQRIELESLLDRRDCSIPVDFARHIGIEPIADPSGRTPSDRTRAGQQ
jgi:DtxR family Mn-dependent transcriptional regulator